MKRSAFFEKTLILIFSNIVTGTITFAFSIILSRKIGPSGMGLYQLVMPLYALFLCISGGGITISISKVAAEEKAKGDYAAIKKTVRSMLIFELIWAAIICVFLMLSAFFLANNVLNDKRTFYSIIAFCPAVLFISLSSVYKGAFYGIQRILEPAFIDVIEKIFRLGILIFLITLIGTTNIPLTSAAAVLSLSAGEFISFMLFFLAYKNYFKKIGMKCKTDNSFQLTLNVLKLSLPLCLNGILATIFSTMITVLIPLRLQISGLTYENALSLLGKLQGMTLSIMFYPTIIIGSLNILLIPSLSEALAFKRKDIINHRINTALRVAAVTAFSSCAIMLSIPIDLGIFFYKDATIGELIIKLIPGIPFMYFQITTFAILNGLGKQKNILINSTILSIFDLVLLYILLAIPTIGINGYAIDFILSSVLGLALNLLVIKRSCTYSLDFYNIIILPVACSVGIFILIKYILLSHMHTSWILILSYIIYILLYYFFYKIRIYLDHS